MREERACDKAPAWVPAKCLWPHAVLIPDDKAGKALSRGASGSLLRDGEAGVLRCADSSQWLTLGTRGDDYLADIQKKDA